MEVVQTKVTGSPVSSTRVSKKRKIFQESWKHEPEFSGWVKRVDKYPNRVFCCACNKQIAAGKSELRKHAGTDRHRDNMLKPNFIPGGPKLIDEGNAPEEDSSSVALAHQKAIKTAEILLANCIAERNVPISFIDYILPVMKRSFPDSIIAQDCSMKRTKCTNIITNILGKVANDNLVKILRINKFSILADETTDISKKKVFCVLARYVSPDSGNVHTELLDLLELDPTDGSAEKIYNSFQLSLREKQIPLQNIVGLACDNASVMIGVRNSFAQRLKLEVPNLILMNCICHSSAIVASKACSKLPNEPEELIRGASMYLSNSPKRCAVLEEYQEFFGEQKLKILSLSNTRWLSLHQCVSRIIHNWEPLKLFFLSAMLEEQSSSAQNLHKLLDDECVKGYFLFLQYSLNFFNSFNALFQSRQFMLHKLAECSEGLIRKIARNFLKKDVIDQLFVKHINVNHPDHFLPLEKINLGPACNQLVQNFPRPVAQQFRLKCLDFYITATSEMKSRLPHAHPIIQHLEFLNPESALDDDINRIKSTVIQNVASHFGHFDETDLAFEWHSLPDAFIHSGEKKRVCALPVDQFWNEVSELKDFTDSVMFPNLTKLTKIILCLPHSNAEAERIFSIVTDVKPRKRNKLGTDCLKSICQIRSSNQCHKVDCTTFQVHQDHLDLHNSNNLYPKQYS
ncbi:uncharacterized protein LOC135169455 [Diachasmimorpha longicaudata]|uniref:uncharacterized protein LOC135169455 n=1 Tax=Diachasmimorpha longicaudata TaxID=58733 RepID=UPI0030B8958C